MKKQPFGDSLGLAVKAAMMIGRKCAVLLVEFLLSGAALAQQACIRGMQIDGVITDPTGAVIPGAHVQAGTGATGVTDATGHFAFACVPVTSTTITADADGFAQAIARAHARRRWRRACQSPACRGVGANGRTGERKCERGRRRPHCGHDGARNSGSATALG